MKVKKGQLAVRVGLEGEDRRFVIPISYLYHSVFNNLLEAAQDVYGFQSSGPLKLPCSVDDFLRLLRLMELERHHSHDQHRHHRHTLFSLSAF